MNRRSFMRLLASLPVVGAVPAVKAAASCELSKPHLSKNKWRKFSLWVEVRDPESMRRDLNRILAEIRDKNYALGS